MKLSPTAEARLSDQISRLERARVLGSSPSAGAAQAMEAATLLRQALAAGHLPTLARRLRHLADDPDEAPRFRARFAILAVGVEGIIERRAAGRKPTPRKRTRKPVTGQKTPRIAIDNRFKGELVACAVCGKEFKATGRNWKWRIHCGPKCTNKAWMKAHPRKAA